MATHMRLMLGWEPFAEADMETRPAIRLLCDALELRTHWNEDEGALYIESPVLGKAVAIGAVAGHDPLGTEVAERVAAELASMLQAAGASLSNRQAAPSPRRHDAILWLDVGSAENHLAWGVAAEYYWRGWSQNRKLASCLSEAISNTTGIPNLGVRLTLRSPPTAYPTWKASPRAPVVTVRLGRPTAEAEAVAVGAPGYATALAKGIFQGLAYYWTGPLVTRLQLAARVAPDHRLLVVPAINPVAESEPTLEPLPNMGVEDLPVEDPSVPEPISEEPSVCGLAEPLEKPESPLDQSLPFAEPEPEIAEAPTPPVKLVSIQFIAETVSVTPLPAPPEPLAADPPVEPMPPAEPEPEPASISTDAPLAGGELFTSAAEAPIVEALDEASAEPEPQPEPAPEPEAEPAPASEPEPAALAEAPKASTGLHPTPVRQRRKKRPATFDPLVSPVGTVHRFIRDVTNTSGLLPPVPRRTEERLARQPAKRSPMPQTAYRPAPVKPQHRDVETGEPLASVAALDAVFAAARTDRAPARPEPPRANDPVRRALARFVEPGQPARKPAGPVTLKARSLPFTDDGTSVVRFP